MNILSHAKKAVGVPTGKITADEFYTMLEDNPSVFEHWETPLEITEYVYCGSSPITHLSKHLTFSGKRENGDSASFYKCKNLKTATGTFQGAVDFSNSSVKKIENINVGKNKRGYTANFALCKNLKIATGKFSGFVSFGASGIESIQNLHIENPDEDGEYADVYDCPNLHTLEGWDLSKPIIIESKKLEAEKKRRTALKKFVQKTQAPELPFL